MEQDPTVKIWVTKDYEIFRRKDGNRDISIPLVNRLVKSIMQNGYYDVSIIVVGDKMTVLDGQHRLEALKRIYKDTGILYKVRYIVSRDFDDLSKIISWQRDRAAWTTLDYARSYAVLGNENYEAYLSFKEKYKTNHQVTASLLGENHHSMQFKAGQFRVNDFSLAEEWVKRLNELSLYYDFAFRNTFVRAMLSFWKDPQFSHKDFMDKVERYRSNLYNCVKVMQFREAIANLYNYNSRKKVKFKFDR